MRTLRSIAATLTLACALAVTTLTVPAHADTRPDAVADRTAVTAGQRTTAAVLGNDRVARKAQARVRIVRAPAALRASVNRYQRIVLAPRPATARGTYRLKYRVTDYKGRTDTALVTVTVRRPAPAPTGPTLDTLIADLPVATERRTGYDRTLFKHWTDSDGDGCDTREEVLIAEAVIAPTVGAGCSLTGGKWYSYYDGADTTDPSTFDIDHMVALAEAWDSGAHAWDADTRMRFANDLGDARSLVAVTASSNRSKSDQDPFEWMPREEITCRYATDWVTTKTRWSLSVDINEKNALASVADRCPDQTVTVTKASIGAGDAPEPTDPAPQPPTGLVLSRIAYDPAGADDEANKNNELVEVTNPTSAPVALSGWTLTDAASATYIFPAQTLPAGATVRIHSGTGTNTGTDLYAGWGYVWNNSGDTATLTTPDGTVADTCTYTGTSAGTVGC